VAPLANFGIVIVARIGKSNVRQSREAARILEFLADGAHGKKLRPASKALAAEAKDWRSLGTPPGLAHHHRVSHRLVELCRSAA
jgi:hypothetical protein